MSGARCPRCGREATEASAFCIGCGAPLRLPDDAPARRLDVTVDLDRRHRGGADGAATVRGVLPPPVPGPAAGPQPGGPGAARELAPVERSHWDLGPLAAAALAEPAPARAPANVAVPAQLRTPLPGRAPLAPPAAAPGQAHASVHPDLDLPEADVDALEVHVERAEPWRRVVAWVVDGVPFAAGGVALGRSVLREATAGRGAPAAIEDVLDLLARERVIAISIAAAVALALASYATLAHALGGATLGKRLVGIRVVGPDGAPPSPARSAIRSFLAVLSGAFLGLGFLVALFTRTGRALHDLLARTWVVKAP